MVAHLLTVPCCGNAASRLPQAVHEQAASVAASPAPSASSGLKGLLGEACSSIIAQHQARRSPSFQNAAATWPSPSQPSRQAAPPAVTHPVTPHSHSQHAFVSPLQQPVPNSTLASPASAGIAFGHNQEQNQEQQQPQHQLPLLQTGSLHNPAQLQHTAADSGMQQTQKKALFGEDHKHSPQLPQSPAWPLSSRDPRLTGKHDSGAWQQQTQAAALSDRQLEINIDSGDEQFGDHHIWSQYLNPQPEPELETQPSLSPDNHAQSEAHTHAQSDSEPASQQLPLDPHSSSAHQPPIQSADLLQHCTDQVSAVEHQPAATADNLSSAHAETAGSPAEEPSGRKADCDNSAGQLQGDDEELSGAVGLTPEHAQSEIGIAKGKADWALQKEDESLADCDPQPERGKVLSAEDTSMQINAQAGNAAAADSSQQAATADTPQAEHQLSADMVVDAQQAASQEDISPSTFAGTHQHGLTDHSMADAVQPGLSCRPSLPQPLSIAASAQVAKQNHTAQSDEAQQAQQQSSGRLADEDGDVDMSDTQQAPHPQEEQLHQEQQPSDVQSQQLQQAQQAQQDVDVKMGEAQHAQQAPGAKERDTQEGLSHDDFVAQPAQEAADCQFLEAEPECNDATQQIPSAPHAHTAGVHVQQSSESQVTHTQPVLDSTLSRSQQAQQAADVQMDDVQQTAGQAPQALQLDNPEALEDLPVQPRSSKRVKGAGTEAAAEAGTKAAEEPATKVSKPEPTTEAAADAVIDEPSQQAEPLAARATRSAAARNASGKPRDGQRQGTVKSADQAPMTGQHAHKAADHPIDDLAAGPSLQQNPPTGQPAVKRSHKKQPKRRRLTAPVLLEDIKVQTSLKGPSSTAATGTQGQQPNQGAVAAADAEVTGERTADQSVMHQLAFAWLLASICITTNYRGISVFICLS